MVVSLERLSHILAGGERQTDGKLLNMKMIDVKAVGRERTEEEKLRRHIHGDTGAKFSQGKRLCLLGGVIGCVTTMATKDNLVCEIYG